jgi:hypothetical protein
MVLFQEFHHAFWTLEDFVSRFIGMTTRICSSLMLPQTVAIRWS